MNFTKMDFIQRIIKQDRLVIILLSRLEDLKKKNFT